MTLHSPARPPTSCAVLRPPRTTRLREVKQNLRGDGVRSEPRVVRHPLECFQKLDLLSVRIDTVSPDLGVVHQLRLRPPKHPPNAIDESDSHRELPDLGSVFREF